MLVRRLGGGSGRGNMIRLATENGNPVPENWDDLPNNTLVTISLPKREVASCYHGLMNVVEACSRLAKSVRDAQEGRHAEAEKETDRTLFCLATSCAHASAVYERVKARVVRANRRKS